MFPPARMRSPIQARAMAESDGLPGEACKEMEIPVQAQWLTQRAEPSYDASQRRCHRLKLRDGRERSYETYVPSGSANGLLLCLHGWLETSSFACEAYCQRYAEQLNYVAACPLGSQRPTDWCTAPSSACQAHGTRCRLAAC